MGQPGPKPLPPEQRRVTVSFRLLPWQIQAIKQEARRRGMTATTAFEQAILRWLSDSDNDRRAA